MNFIMKVFLSLIGGMFVGTGMMTGKSGQAFYHFSIDSRFIPTRRAVNYWGRALRENPKLSQVQDAEQARKIVIDRFRADLTRMKWTWDAELNWDPSIKTATQPVLASTESDRP